MLGAGAVRLSLVCGWCAPHWAFFPWRQVKQQCRSHSVTERWRGLEKGYFACCFLMSKGESTRFSARGFDFITSLSLWCGLAWPYPEFHNSFVGFIKPRGWSTVIL